MPFLDDVGLVTQRRAVSIFRAEVMNDVQNLSNNELLQIKNKPN
jgi:hypothetical protein